MSKLYFFVQTKTILILMTIIALLLIILNYVLIVFLDFYFQCDSMTSLFSAGFTDQPLIQYVSTLAVHTFA